jgi:hypothetical protein
VAAHTALRDRAAAAPVSRASATVAFGSQPTDAARCFSRAADDPDGDYVSGDYWLIPARVATGDVEWPTSVTGQPIPEPPKGVHYHYALLADVDPANEQNPVTDLRPMITQIASGGVSGEARPAPAPPAQAAAPAPMVKEAPTQHEVGVNPTAANRPEITPPVIFPGEPPATA